MFAIWCAVVLTTLVTMVFGQFQPPAGFDHDMFMDSDEKYRLYWKYDQETITFEVHVETLGYVGLGLSTRGRMVGSDIVIARFVNGQPELTDRHATSRSLPSLDAEQNWRLLAARRSNTHSLYRFSRYLRVCGSARTQHEDMDIKDETVRLIFAYSPSSDLVYHGQATRGTRSVHLLRVLPTRGNLPADARSYDFRINRHTIPPEHTSYFCALLPAPVFRTKHHVIAFETLTTPGNEGTVHHMTVYGCYDAPPNGRRIGEQWNCYNAGTNMPSSHCTSSIFGWAVGSSRFYFPDDTGFPIGGGTQPAYMFLEIHYDNQAFRRNIADDSGLRLWVSPTVRRYDTGTLQIGAAIGPDFQVVPPRQRDWTTHGHCPNSCLREVMSRRPRGVTVFAHLLHTHSAGTSVNIRHLRGARELRPIATDSNYDFNFQELRLMKQPANLRPEDSLLVECKYDTRQKRTLIKGGMTTRNEMCYAYVLYYPVLDVTWCLSYPTAKQTLSGIPSVGAQNVVEHGNSFPVPLPEAEGKVPGIAPQPAETMEPTMGMSLYGTYSIQRGPYRGMNLQGVLAMQNWASAGANVTLQRAVLSGQMGTFCRRENFDFQSSGNVEFVPNIWYPYVETQQRCMYGQPPATATAEPTTATTPYQTDNCRDTNERQCAFWRTSCNTVPLVRSYCPRTCSVCTTAGECTDLYPDLCALYVTPARCAGPVIRDYCRKHCGACQQPGTTARSQHQCSDFFDWCGQNAGLCSSGFTRFMCPRYCRFCNHRDCVDQSSYCGLWRNQGFCESSQSTRIMCPRACSSGCAGRS